MVLLSLVAKKNFHFDIWLNMARILCMTKFDVKLSWQSFHIEPCIWKNDYF